MAVPRGEVEVPGRKTLSEQEIRLMDIGRRINGTHQMALPSPLWDLFDPIRGNGVEEAYWVGGR